VTMERVVRGDGDGDNCDNCEGEGFVEIILAKESAASSGVLSLFRIDSMS